MSAVQMSKSASFKSKFQSFNRKIKLETSDLVRADHDPTNPRLLQSVNGSVSQSSELELSIR
eukprot:1797680-Lingulodinium_polyedra.AAC.1